MSVPIELPVGELFTKDDYLIPLYQRNYAWEQAQVTQLIRDIWDFHLDGGNYYIGTLVTHLTEKDNKTCYETIDGQQRLTTLNILFSVLKREFGLTIDHHYELRLKFESRPVSSATLKVLADFGLGNNKTAINTKMSQAYANMRRELWQLAGGDKKKIVTFTSYLFEHVRLLRVVVPADTDLNHYFEIMNNRGEQLEKQEILKSRFLKLLEADQLGSKVFAQIWEACSVMNRYMIFGFKRALRDALFLADDHTWDYFPDDFAEICERAGDHLVVKAGGKSSKTLLSLMMEPAADTEADEEEEETGRTFDPVIDFPNFLLQVLRVWTGKNLPLDDKRLLKTFGEAIAEAKDKAAFARDFAYQLLRSRFMFDTCVIKRETEVTREGWSLLNLKIRTDKKRSFYYVNSFEAGKQEQIIMLLSMFHVSFPQMIYKHWLCGVLSFLMDGSILIDEDEYILYLEKLSDAFYFDRFGKKTWDYYDIIFKHDGAPQQTEVVEQVLNGGTDVQNFIFNRLDYLIWRSIMVDEEDTFDIPNADNFVFSSRSSVEHYFPQHPLPGIDGSLVRPAVRDNFGNLCLISNSRNSSLSNNSPIAKADYYGQSDIIESLKQRLMMQQSRNWDEQAIMDHQKLMVKVLSQKS